MAAVILAIGRRDNHAIVKAEAEKLGLTYLPIESHLASGYIQNPELISKLVKKADKKVGSSISQPTILTAIDSSVGAATLRSFAARSNEIFQLPISLRSDPRVLDALGSSDQSQSQSQSQIRDEEGDEYEEGDEEADGESQLFLITVARSSHGQLSIWPIVKLQPDRSSYPIASNTFSQIEELDEMIAIVSKEVIDFNLIGVLTYVFNSSAKIVLREWGVAPINFWSENSCYTGVSEQLVRSIIDLPLGDISLIDLDSYYLEEVVDLKEGSIATSSNNFRDYDPVRPLLHLYARNPKLKIHYLDGEKTVVKISLFNDNEIFALEEMAHAREFLLGN